MFASNHPFRLPYLPVVFLNTFFLCDSFSQGYDEKNGKTWDLKEGDQLSDMLAITEISSAILL